VVPAHVRSELAIDIAHDEVPVWLLGEPVGCKVELRWNAGRERDGGAGPREQRGDRAGLEGPSGTGHSSIEGLLGHGGHADTFTRTNEAT